MSETVIRVENISKKYRLGVINRRMLVDQIESWVFRKLGKPDPHASVFEKATDRMPTPYDFWALKDVSFEVDQEDLVGNLICLNSTQSMRTLKLTAKINAEPSAEGFWITPYPERGAGSRVRRFQNHTRI